MSFPSGLQTQLDDAINVVRFGTLLAESFIVEALKAFDNVVIRKERLHYTTTVLPSLII